MHPTGRLRDVTMLFLKMGLIGFGGPAAHIALMRREFVERKGWYDNEEFLRMVGLTNLIPGPNSTELAMHIGHRRAGAKGLILSGIAFIAPAVLFVGFLAWLYTEFGTTPGLADLRYGTGPVVAAIVAQAAVVFLRSTGTSAWRIILVAAAFGVSFAGVNELLVLVCVGLVAVVILTVASRPPHSGTITLALPIGMFAAADTPTLARLFALFLKIGAILYGSGYVLIAFLESDFVTRREWISEEQLIDAVTVGQVTPGPLFSTATFVGWITLGVAGAALATVGIFAPSFLFVGAMGRLLPWIERHRIATHFISGVTIGSVGIMLTAVVHLGRTSLVDPFTITVGVATLLLLLRTRVNSLWLILAGVCIGIARILM